MLKMARISVNMMRGRCTEMCVDAHFAKLTKIYYRILPERSKKTKFKRPQLFFNNYRNLIMQLSDLF